MNTAVNTPLWKNVAGLPMDVLVEFIRHEYPQTVAVIFSILEQIGEQSVVAKIIEGLPAAFAVEVVKRRANLHPVKWWAIIEMERGIKADLEQWNNFGNRSRSTWHHAVTTLVEAGVCAP